MGAAMAARRDRVPSSSMWRALLIALMLAACGEGGESPPDADVPPDGPDGSGSNVVFEGEDPSPPDVTLQWIVVGLSVLIVGRARVRRV
jgi:hypothetical protein